MQQANQKLYSIILYTLGFLLFWEWLRPLSVITDTGSIELFVIFMAFSFFLSFLQFPFWLTFPVKVLAILFSIHVLFFFYTPVSDPLWLKYLFEDLKTNAIFLFNGNWAGLSGIFRSLLFFVLLWIVSYLMHYWLIQTRKLFMFFFITVVYLGVVDTFTMYHAESAIVRTMIIGFILLGLLRVMKIQEAEKVVFDKGRLPISWVIALAITIVFTSVVGYAAPKAGPQWPDPVPFITKAPNGYGSDSVGRGGFQKIGYDNDDRNLGGAFTDDQTVVFTTYDERAHYWRIESKDFYTGKGWINKAETSSVKVDPNHIDTNDALKFYEPDTEVKTEEATIKLELKNFPQLLYEGVPMKISGNGTDIFLNTALEKLEPMKNSRHITLPKYNLTYKYPTYNIQRLRESSNNYPEEIKDRYLQLPSTLPSRVKDLAEEVTKDEDNRFDKAKAIEVYFKNNGYVYETQDVAKPDKDQDYVDQFIFDTKKGYCDNFSSSMVVMLREVGIPARWVKGFTQGDYKETDSHGLSVYEVRNSNAHSWVEAYFPNVGWVPFEPTMSFANLADFDYSTLPDNNSNTGPEATPASAVPENKKKLDQQDPKEEQSKQTVSSVSSKEMTSIETFATKIFTQTYLVIIIILLLMTALIFKTRFRWLPSFTIFRFKKRRDQKAFDDAMKRLLWLLGQFGYKRETGQTLREYALKIDHALGSSEMQKLTLNYEKNRYTNQVDQDLWKLSRDSWETIIKNLKA